MAALTDGCAAGMQRNNLFYPGWVYTIPTALLRLPFSAVEGVVWGVLVYWLVGLDPEPGRWAQATPPSHTCSDGLDSVTAQHSLHCGAGLSLSAEGIMDQHTALQARKRVILAHALACCGPQQFFRSALHSSLHSYRQKRPPGAQAARPACWHHQTAGWSCMGSLWRSPDCI